LGALVLGAIAFSVAMFFLRGGVAMHSGFTRGTFPRMGGFTGRMGGLIPLGVLVLAGFGVAYLVKQGKHTTPPAAVQAPTCASCGKPLNAEWTTCPYCGKPVEAPVTPPAEQK
jgi:hypothetical protein